MVRYIGSKRKSRPKKNDHGCGFCGFCGFLRQPFATEFTKTSVKYQLFTVTKAGISLVQKPQKPQKPQNSIHDVQRRNLRSHKKDLMID